MIKGIKPKGTPELGLHSQLPPSQLYSPGSHPGLLPQLSAARLRGRLSPHKEGTLLMLSSAEKGRSTGIMHQNQHPGIYLLKNILTIMEVPSVLCLTQVLSPSTARLYGTWVTFPRKPAELKQGQPTGTSCTFFMWQ